MQKLLQRFYLNKYIMGGMKVSTREMMEELKMLFNLMDYEVYETVGNPYNFRSFCKGAKKVENIMATKNDTGIAVTVRTYPTFKQFSVVINGEDTFQCQTTYDKCYEVRDKIMNEVKKAI